MTGFSATILGDIEKDLRRDIGRYEKAAQSAIRKAGFNIQQGWKKQIERAGLGRRLPRTIRFKFFKNRGFDPAILIFTRAPKLIRAFDQGVTIRASRTRYLAIPTENAPKRGTGGGRGPLAARISPRNFPEERFGKLRFVPERGSRPALLVVNNVRRSVSAKTGRIRVSRASSRARKRGEAQSVVMFILVRQVTIRKRTDVESIVKRVHERVPEFIDRFLAGEDLRNVQ